MADTYQQQAINYYQLTKMGVPAQVAYQMSFPKGLPTQEEVEKKQSNSALASTASALAASLAARYGIKYATNAVKDYFATQGVKNASDAAAKAVAEATTKGATQGAAQAATRAGAEAGTQAVAQGVGQAGASAGAQAGASAAGAGASAWGQAAEVAVQPVGLTTTAAGQPAVILADGTTKAVSAAAAQSAAEAGTQAAAASGAEAGTQAAAGAGAEAGAGYWNTAGQWVTYAAWAYQAYQLHKKLQSDDLTNEEKGREAGKAIGLGVADYFTFGGASFTYGLLQQSSEWRDFEEEMERYDSIGATFGALGKVFGGEGDSSDYMDLATGGLYSTTGQVLGFHNQKSTKEYQFDRYRALHPAFKGDKEGQAAWEHLDPKKKEHDGTWKVGKYAGEKWTFDKALDLAKENPWHFVGSMGNAETFGPEFLDLPQNKQLEITRRAVEEGLYHSNKGNVLISDENQPRAKEIFNEVKNLEDFNQEFAPMYTDEEFAQIKAMEDAENPPIEQPPAQPNELGNALAQGAYQQPGTPVQRDAVTGRVQQQVPLGTLDASQIDLTKQLTPEQLLALQQQYGGVYA